MSLASSSRRIAGSVGARLTDVFAKPIVPNTIIRADSRSRLESDLTPLDSLPTIASEFEAAKSHRLDLDTQNSIMLNLRSRLRDLMETALTSHTKQSAMIHEEARSRRFRVRKSKRRSSDIQERLQLCREENFGVDLPDDNVLWALANFYTSRFQNDAFPFAVLMRTPTAMSSRWSELMSDIEARESCPRTIGHVLSAVAAKDGPSASLKQFYKYQKQIQKGNKHLGYSKQGLSVKAKQRIWTCLRPSVEAAINKNDTEAIAAAVAAACHSHVVDVIDMDTIESLLRLVDEKHSRWVIPPLLFRLRSFPTTEWPDSIFAGLARALLVVRDADTLISIFEDWKARETQRLQTAPSLSSAKTKEERQEILMKNRGVDLARRSFSRSFLAMRMVDKYHELVDSTIGDASAPVEYRMQHLTLEAHVAPCNDFVKLLKAVDQVTKDSIEDRFRAERDAAVLLAFGREQRLDEFEPRRALSRWTSRPGWLGVHTATAIDGLVAGGRLDQALSLGQSANIRTASTALAFALLRNGRGDETSVILEEAIANANPKRVFDSIRPALFTAVMLSMPLSNTVDIESTFQRITSLKLEPSLSAITVLLASHAYCGHQDKSDSLLKQLQVKESSLKSLLRRRDDVVHTAVDLYDGLRWQDSTLLKGFLDVEEVEDAIASTDDHDVARSLLRVLTVLGEDDKVIGAVQRCMLDGGFELDQKTHSFVKALFKRTNQIMPQVPIARP